MSAALVRQALEFVDPDESVIGKGKKRGAARRRLPGGPGQVKLLKQSFKKQKSGSNKKKQEDEVVQKLLKLSQPTVSAEIAEKIVERAVKGKALADKIEINTEPEKRILFSDNEEEFDQFEEELFCS